MLKDEAASYYKTNPEKKSEIFLIDKACQEVKLYDWGNTNFVAPLRRLLVSCRKEGGFNSFGWYFIHSLLIKYLCGRLLIQHQYKQYPEIRKEQIRQPLFIIGLPRTGTTFLQRLLSQIPSCRALLYWEALSPAPFPTSNTQKTDPRIQVAKEFLQIRNSVLPTLNIMHSSYVYQPEECFHLLDKSFISPQLHLLFDLPSYYKWLRKQDMLPVYRYYKEQLQILQFTKPHTPQQRWVLKAPLHMFGIKALLEVFPDACIVQPHRSPVQSLASLCSMLATIRKNLQKKTLTDQLGRETVLFCNNMLDNFIQVRQEYGAERFIDVNYSILTKDPISIVKKINDHFGISYNETIKKRMNEWLLENPKNKHGLHKYSSKKYGLSNEMISQYFSKYYNFFGEALDNAVN
ncbi:MAG: sulfotransferase [Desulfobacterales bacterium]|nr:sulfotransferase [Desulfobacterales bacterium]